MPYKDPSDPRNKESRLRHYYKNREYYIQRAREQKKEKRDFLVELRKKTPCFDCKERFPYFVMEFDHREKNKIGNVSTLATSSWRLLKEEIAKCDIVCANCHRKRTHNRRLV